MTTRWDFERAVFASGLPAPSRLVLLTLAAHTDAGSLVIPEKFTPSLATIADKTGLDRRSVMRHLDALDAAGWVDRRKPDIAAQRTKHARTRYRLTIPAGVSLPPDLGVQSHQPGGTEPPEVGAQSHRAGGTVPPNQNKNIRTTQTSRHADPFAGLDATDDERTAVIARITQAGNIRNLPGYLATLAANGDLADHLAAVRDDTRRAKLAAELERARTGPECIHGRPGGQHRRSDTGKLLCPQCETNLERSTA